MRRIRFSFIRLIGFCSALLFSISHGQGVGISETSITPPTSAILELRSSLRGFLVPRLTVEERDAISSPVQGLMIFNTTTGEFNFYDGSGWVSYYSLTNIVSGGIPYFNSSTSKASSGLLTANALIIGGGAGGSPSTIGLGTTTTVLHGNAIGAPFFGSVSLSADVSGNLPTGNLNNGTGATSTTFWRGDALWATPKITSVNVQTFTANGIYTPSSGMVSCLVICVGGGGAGAGGIATDEAGGGGGGGGTAIKLIDAATVGASQSITVGASSTGAGNSSSFGAILSATGGAIGSSTGTSTTVGVNAAGGIGGVGSGGDLNIEGGSGGRGIIFSTNNGIGGNGGSSYFGGGGLGSGSNAAGSDGGNYGAGGGGGHARTATDRLGGSGAPGVIYIIEYIQQ